MRGRAAKAQLALHVTAGAKVGTLQRETLKPDRWGPQLPVPDTRFVPAKEPARPRPAGRRAWALLPSAAGACSAGSGTRRVPLTCDVIRWWEFSLYPADEQGDEAGDSLRPWRLEGAFRRSGPGHLPRTAPSRGALSRLRTVPLLLPCGFPYSACLRLWGSHTGLV